MSLRPVEAPKAVVSYDPEYNLDTSPAAVHAVAKDRISRIPYKNKHTAFWSEVIRYAEELKKTELGRRPQRTAELNAIIQNAGERMRALAALAAQG